MSADELASRMANPAIFAAADDLAEAELARIGEFQPPPARSVDEIDEELALLIDRKIARSGTITALALARAIRQAGWTKGGVKSA